MEEIKEKYNHTGQGQIIEAKSITQDKNGNWIPATPEPYHPTWLIEYCVLLVGIHGPLV